MLSRALEQAKAFWWRWRATPWRRAVSTSVVLGAGLAIAGVWFGTVGLVGGAAFVVGSVVYDELSIRRRRRRGEVARDVGVPG